MVMTPYTTSNPYSVGGTDYQAGINFDRMRAERLHRTQEALQRHNMAAALVRAARKHSIHGGRQGTCFCATAELRVGFRQG